MSDFDDSIEEVSDYADNVISDTSDFEDVPASKQKTAKSKSKPLTNGQNKVNSTKKSPDTNHNTKDDNSSTSTTKNGNASDQYQKLSQLEHILKRPDTYIGSIEKSPVEMWVYDEPTDAMVQKEVNIVPGLYKIFDEILVNAADNKIRDPSMKSIEVNIFPEDNLIQVKNDGRGIPVEIHDKEKIYIPELIFGNLLTSSNYDDDEKKVTGGRNGFGAKLCNIFSTEFTIETADKNTGLLYVQTWKDNMSVIGKPKITKMKNKQEFTRISFKPDLAKFNMEILDDAILGVLKRRVYDLCGTVKNITVSLNGKKLPVRNFKQYVEMYVKAIQAKSPDQADDTAKVTIVHEVFNERWEVAFAVSDGSFNQISFVNSIATTSGGTHIKYLSDQIITKVIEALSKKEKGKKKLMIKPFEVRNNMFLFINCLIENPAFNSQTKEQLTTRSSQFGGKNVNIQDSFINKILKTSIVDKIRDIADRNEDKALQKGDGSKKSRIKGQVKLADANKAGTKDGYKCTLILTEGDSAMALALAGLAVVGRDFYGCFPLRGKLLNVREASTDQVMKNTEISALKQIIGLQHKKRYSVENIKTLRYGHIMIMTDQDHDGSHIKGLIINFLETSFPGLLEVPGFLIEFITPIIKVTISGGARKEVISFYTMPEYEHWRDTEGTTCRWKCKYYKGLGTSTDQEGREYFSRLDKHLKTFHALQEDDKGLIDLAFSKKKADDRKEWLRGFQPGTHLDPNLAEIPISDFINKELILFSMADNIRSIPSILDGFKPGQRKVLYGCFKRNLTSEIKVAQLAGYVSEHTGYHHGEQSLVQTIIGLAQNFIGSNNINLLQPNGAFGTRATGGKDASAPRYIFTELSKITRKIFNPLDDPLYTYSQDDEQTVEPEWYLPVIPMLLVNGAEGIGTGWSTNIPPFNPVDIVNNIRKLMAGEELLEMVPWFRGWEGEIEKVAPDRYKMSGRIEQIDNTTLEITEIPAKTWTTNMKEFLLQGLGTEKVKPWIKDMEEQHSIGIKFVVTLSQEEMEKSYKIGLLERFKLTSSVNLSNMVAFDQNGRIKKYDSVLDILTDFYYVRLDYYQRRKDFLTDKLKDQLEKLSQQARFIKLIIDKKLVVSNRKRVDLISSLQEFNFPMFNKEGKPIFKKVSDSDITQDELFVQDEEETSEAETDEATFKPDNVVSSYDYLLGMAIWSLTREKYEKLLQQCADKESELTELLKLSAKDLWNHDLDQFLVSWEQFLEKDFENRASIIPAKGTKKVSKRTRKVKDEDDDKNVKKKKTTPANAKVATKSASKVATKPQVKSENSTSDGTDDTKKIKEGKQAVLPFKKSTPDEDEFKLPTFFGKGNTIFGTPKKDKDPFDLDADSLLSNFSSKFGSASSVTTENPPKSKASSSDDDADGKSSASSRKITAPKKKLTKSQNISKSTTPSVSTSNQKGKSKKAGFKNTTVLSSDDDDFEVAEPASPVSRPRRAAKASYKIPDDSEADSDADSDDMGSFIASDEDVNVITDDSDDDFE